MSPASWPWTARVTLFARAWSRIAAFFGNVENRPVQTQGARAFRATAVRMVRAAAPEIKEARKVVLTITVLFVIMAAIAAFDVWVWVPRSIYQCGNS